MADTRDEQHEYHRDLGRLEGALETFARENRDSLSRLEGLMRDNHRIVEQHIRDDAQFQTGIKDALEHVKETVDRIKKPIDAFISARHIVIGVGSIVAAVGAIVAGVPHALYVTVLSWIHPPQ